MSLRKFDGNNQETIRFSAFVLVSLYLILYNPVLIITGTGLLKPMVLIGSYCFFLRFCLNSKKNGGLWRHTDKIIQYKISIIPIILVVFFLFAITIGQVLALFGGSDEVYNQLFRSFVSTFLPLICLMIWFIPRNCNTVKSIIVMTAVIGTLQSIFIILDGIFPGVRDIFSSVVMQPNNINDSFRAAGLTSMSGDGLSFSQAICGLCSFFMMLRSNNNKSRLVWSLSFTLIFLSMMLVSRTGIVILLIFSGFITVFSRSNFKLRAYSILFLSMFMLTIISTVYFFMLAIDPDRLTFFLDTLLPYAFEFVFSYFEGYGFTTSSTDDMINNMLIYPDNPMTLIFGDGYYSNPADVQQNYMGTDIGYLRILFYVGIVGSLFIYLWYILLAYFCSRVLVFFEYRVLFFAIFGSIMVANIKFPFVLQSASICFALLLLFATHRGRVWHS